MQWIESPYRLTINQLLKMKPVSPGEAGTQANQGILY